MKEYSRVIVAQKGTQLFVLEDSSMMFSEIDDKLKAHFAPHSGPLILKSAMILREDDEEDE